MSRNAELTQTWADGEYTFRLGIRELIMLQEKRDAGPPEIMARLANGMWRVEDLIETIRIGLIGGGTEPKTALRLVRDYVENRPLYENLPLAQLIIGAALVGALDEPLGESGAASRTKPNGSTTSPTEKSDLPPSTPLEAS